MTKLRRMLYDSQFKMEDRERYLKETMPLWLGYFENLAPPLAKQVDVLSCPENSLKTYKT